MQLTLGEQRTLFSLGISCTTQEEWTVWLWVWIKSFANRFSPPNQDGMASWNKENHSEWNGIGIVCHCLSVSFSGARSVSPSWWTRVTGTARCAPIKTRQRPTSVRCVMCVKAHQHGELCFIIILFIIIISCIYNAPNDALSVNRIHITL